jgi:hypothetical protein
MGAKDGERFAAEVVIRPCDVGEAKLRKKLRERSELFLAGAVGVRVAPRPLDPARKGDPPCGLDHAVEF